LILGDSRQEGRRRVGRERWRLGRRRSWRIHRMRREGS